MTKKLIVPISRASGSIYGVTLIKELLTQQNIKHNLAGELGDENLV